MGDDLNFMKNFFTKETFVLAGDAIIASTVQYALAGTEMTTRFDIIHYAKTQEVLEHAAEYLINYIKIGSFVGLFLVILYYYKYGKLAAIISLLTNILIMTSIYYSYLIAFEESAKRNKLQFPKINFFKNIL